MHKRIFRIEQRNPQVAHTRAAALDAVRSFLASEQDIEIEVREPRRTLDANAAMWATLTDMSQQVKWWHTRKGEWVEDLMSKDAWKAVLTAAFESETESARGVDGGQVMLGARTSQYSRKRMGDFIEFVHAIGTERGVRWSARAEEELAAYSMNMRNSE